jgi:Mg-chelatase subunit ChlD
MQHRIFVSLVILSLNLVSVQRVCADDGESAAPKAADAPMHGRVLKNEGALPRLNRPGLSAESSANSQSMTAKMGLQETVNSDVLRARVLNAAGLGEFKSMTPGSDRTHKANSYSLTTKELNHLSQYDISVVIDASGSMAQKDCMPLNVFNMSGNVSRWEWCRQQTSILSDEIAPVFPKGITVIPFATRAVRIPNVSPSAIESIFNETRPGGATRLDMALDLEFTDYFNDKEKGVKRKPLLIAVITDGVPSNPQRIVNEVLEVSRNVRPGDLRIEFFVIGGARRGIGFVDFLTHLSSTAGAPFDIVTEHPFSELCDDGLPRSLARAVTQHN